MTVADKLALLQLRKARNRLNRMPLKGPQIVAFNGKADASMMGLSPQAAHAVETSRQ